MTEHDITHDAVREECEAIIEYGLEMLEQDLTTGTGGNVSARVDDDLMAISPSGIPYEEIEAEDVSIVDFEGEQVLGPYAPSNESPMHVQVYRERDDVGGIVHNHSPYATTFATLNEPIPATHYLIAFAGDEVPVAPYVTYGTEELGRLAVETIGDEYDACLLANHGVLTVGEDVASAFETALMVEYCARIQYQAASIGEPTTLPDEEVATLRSKFAGYGQQK